MDNNDVEISKIVNIGIDINITKSLTVSKIQQPMPYLITPGEQERYILAEMARQLTEETEVDWGALDEAYYFLKLKKEKINNGEYSFMEYNGTLYPAKLKDHAVRVKVPAPEPIDCSGEAEWKIEMSHRGDIASAYPTITCSACGGTSLLQETPYCPYCGRRMTNGHYTPRK